MNKLHRRTLLPLLIAPTVTRAQGSDWPKGPIRVVVPFPPGGTTDPVARLLAAKVSDNTGWQTIIDNKPGAAGAIGAAIVAKAPPDGMTWMITFDSHILSPAFTPHLTYTDTELLNVMLVGRAPLAIACHPDRPYQSMRDVVADARARPGKVSVGLLSASGALLLTAYLQEGQRLRGSSTRSTTRRRRADGAGRAGRRHRHHRHHLGRAAAALPRRQAARFGDHGRQARAPSLPDVLTLGEQGLQTYPTYSWWGVYVPTGTPRPIVDRLNAELAKAARSPDVAQKFAEQIDMEIVAGTPEQFAAFQASEQERWFKVIKDNNIKGD